MPQVSAQIGITTGLAAAGVVGFLAYRQWHLRWGSTDEEVQRAFPGDDVVIDPSFNATRAVTVNVTPEDIWPWIVQMGYGRAGWYTYDLLDNLGRRSADKTIPSLQGVEVGDVVPMGPGGAGLRVKDFVHGEWLLWWDGAGRSTWLWSLTEIAPGQTRLVTRIRTRYRWAHPSILFALLLMEPWDFPMMRKCLLGIKQRAESTLEQAATPPADRRPKMAT